MKILIFLIINLRNDYANIKNMQIKNQINNNLNTYEVAVIGSGATGCTSSIYTSRGNKKVVMFTGNLWGGLLTTTKEVYNYPGYKIIDGLKLMENMIEQVIASGVQVKEEYVIKVNFSKDKMIPHEIITSNGNNYKAFVVIIATGAKHKHLNINGPNFDNNGVYYCATCDGTLFVNNPNPVVVVGGGNTALTEALYLSGLVKKVILIHRRNEFRAEAFLINKIQNTSNIEIIYDSEIKEVKGDSYLTSVIIENNKTLQTNEITTNGLFIAIGFQPNTEIFKSTELKILEGGYIATHPVTFATNVPGVYSAGDATDHIYRQAITGAGDGCKCAIQALQYLNFLES